MDLPIIEGFFPLILHSYAHKHIQTFMIYFIYYTFNDLNPLSRSGYNTGLTICFSSLLIRYISDVHK